MRRRFSEAVGRPSRRYVAVKTAEQQAVLALHRARQGFVQARTAQANQIRGLLSEHGLTVPPGIRHMPSRLTEILEDGENELPGAFRALLKRLGDHLQALDLRWTSWTGRSRPGTGSRR